MIDENRLRNYLARLTLEVYPNSLDLARITIKELNECFVSDELSEKGETK